MAREREARTTRRPIDPPIAPRIAVEPPGPRSRKLLDRAARILYPGLAHHQAPFVMARKSGYVVEDVDGNVYLDFLSGMASVPFGSVAPEILEPTLAALATYGNDDGHFYPTTLMVELAEALLADRARWPRSRRYRPQWDRGRRDRRPLDAALDGPPDDPRLHGWVSRRVRHHGCHRGRGSRDHSGHRDS